MAAFDEAADALARIAKGLADDWGWRGGKPGEITGGEYLRLYDDAERAARTAAKNVKKPRGYTEGMDYLREQEYLDTMYEKLGDATDKFAEQMRPKLQDLGLNADALDGYGIETIYDYARQFADFEKAGIPREFTGSAFRILNTQRSSGLDAKTIGDALRSMWRTMTNDQRQTFFNLLPRWTGTLEQAASAAKKLYRRPS